MNASVELMVEPMVGALSVAAVVLAVLAAVYQLVAGRAGTRARAVAISAVILVIAGLRCFGARVERGAVADEPPTPARPTPSASPPASSGSSVRWTTVGGGRSETPGVRSVGAFADAPVLPVIEVAGLEGACWLLTAGGEVVALDAVIDAADGGPCPDDGGG